MKNIKPETIQAMNKKLGLNYSEDRYSLLEDLKVISITTMDTESTEELSSMYKEKLFKLPLHKNDILNEMENCMDMTVSEMLISLGRKKCLDTYEVNNAVVTVLKKAVLSESKIETYSNLIEEPAQYYFEDSNLKIGEDFISYHRLSRCFAVPTRTSSFEYHISKLAALLNLEEDRLTCINKGNYYSVLLDNKEIGIWSLELMLDFYEESMDIYYSENHAEDYCIECSSDEYCKYGDSSCDLTRRLISDELNLPIFSVSRLVEILSRNVWEK